MRKLAFVVLVLVLFSTALFAQKGGVEVGYSYLRVNPGDPAPSVNTNGFEIQPILLLPKHFALVADITGAYGSNSGLKVHDYLFAGGPAYVIPVGKVGLANLHVVVGANHINVADGTYKNTALAIAPGGALDFKVAKKVYFRAAEVDYVYTRHDLSSLELGKSQNHFRYGAGLLFLF